MKKINLVIMILVIMAASVNAAFKESAWWGNRPAGMGGTFVGIADDSNAIIYNTAGLSQIEHPEANFMYAKLYTGLDEVNIGLNYFAAVLPLENNGGLGFGWANFVEDSYKENTFSIGYGRWINEYIAGGLALKYLGHEYVLSDNRSRNDPVFADGNSKYAVTADAGLFSKIPLDVETKNVYLGVSIKNLTQPDIGLKEKDVIPAEVSVGGSYKNKETIFPALDLTYRLQDWGDEGQKVNFHVGGETWFFNHLLGIRAGADVSQITAGFSVSHDFWNLNLEFDYSFLFPLELQETNGTHHLSFAIKFL